MAYRIHVAQGGAHLSVPESLRVHASVAEAQLAVELYLGPRIGAAPVRDSQSDCLALVDEGASLTWVQSCDGGTWHGYRSQADADADADGTRPDLVVYAIREE